MSEWLGEIIKEVFDKDSFHSKIIKRFKVRLSLNKANIKRLKAILYEQESWNHVLDLTVDVWGGAGPDCRTMPA